MMRLSRVGVLLLFLAATRSPALDGVPEETLRLEELVRLPEKDLARVDIAAVNLAAAEGLPGSQSINRAVVLRTLDEWARQVAIVTAYHVVDFRARPEEYDHSWGKFCAYHLLRTLQLYLGAYYNDQQRETPDLARSQDLFLHGLVQGTGGTCASLPVMYVAVGRRLGYPLRLAQGFSHYYVRWDDPATGEQFNIDGSGDGYAFHADAHYREWPRHLGAEELEQGNYLRSLSPREELSVFLTTRGDCLRANGLGAEALRTYEQAVELAPRNAFADGLRQGLIHELQRAKAQRELAAMLEEQERRRRTDPRVMIPGMPEVPAAHAVSVRPVAPGTTRRGAVFGQMPDVGRGGEAMRSALGAAGPAAIVVQNLEGTDWQPSFFGAYLEATQQRNEALRELGRSILYRRDSRVTPAGPPAGSLPAIPMPAGGPPTPLPSDATLPAVAPPSGPQEASVAASMVSPPASPSALPSPAASASEGPPPAAPSFAPPAAPLPSGPGDPGTSSDANHGGKP